MREDRLFLLLSVVIGIFSGLAVVCFRLAIEWTQITLLGSSLVPSFPRVVLAPTIAGLVVAFLALRVFPAVRGSGVNQTKSAFYISNGYIPFSTVIGKFIACGLAIGSGQSLGPEDPSLQMGAGIASLIGRRLRLSQERLRLIAPVGAAAGLAAAFNAPISAVLFVIEEVIGQWSAGALGAIVLAAVSSVVTMRAFLGADSLFRVPPFRVAGAFEMLAYVVLGIAGGFASLILLKWIVYARPKLMALPQMDTLFAASRCGIIDWGDRHPVSAGDGRGLRDRGPGDARAIHLEDIAGAGGIEITGDGIFVPERDARAELLRRRFLSERCWAAAVGAIEHHFFPGLTGTVGTFALVGIGTLFAGFLRTPITSVFMVIELSGNYTAILPVIISTMVAYGISRAYQKVPLFDVLARQDGTVLPSLEERREMMSLAVEDAMRPVNAVVCEPGDSIPDIARRAEAQPDVALLLRVKPGEWWILDRDEVIRMAPDASPTTTAIRVKSKGPLPYLFPDQTLSEALAVMADWALLPVANRANLAKLEGVLTLEDTLMAFRKAPKEE